jgi:hypothetical protein
MKKADDGVPQTVAPIERKVSFYVRTWQSIGVSMKNFDQKMGCEHLPRRSHQPPDGELLTSRQDG